MSDPHPVDVGAGPGASSPTPAPGGHAFEPAWFVEARYAPDAAEARVPFRAEHLDRMAALQEAGTLLMVAAAADVSASLLVFRAGSEDEVRELLRADAYTRNGVWTEFRIVPVNRLVPAAG